MKNVSKFVALFSLVSVVASVGLKADLARNEEAYLAYYQGQPAAQIVPVAVVSPEPVPYVSGEVEVAMVVDKAGKPTRIEVMSASDEALARSAIKAVAQWEFAPAQRDGMPIEKKVVVPFTFLGRS